MSWSDERIEKLKMLAAEGLSANQIAVEFGDVSRSTVLGKLHRLGIVKKSSVRRPGRRRLLPETPLLGAVTFMELQPHHCRWPNGSVGTPDFFFCGDARAFEGLPYCATHCQIAYQARRVS